MKSLPKSKTQNTTFDNCSIGFHHEKFGDQNFYMPIEYCLFAAPSTFDNTSIIHGNTLIELSPKGDHFRIKTFVHLYVSSFCLKPA